MATKTKTKTTKSDVMVFEGTVTEALPGTTFRVELETGQDVLCTLAGKMRKHRIRVLLGDAVTVEVSTYDPTRGRISYRHKN